MRTVYPRASDVFGDWCARVGGLAQNQPIDLHHRLGSVLFFYPTTSIVQKWRSGARIMQILSFFRLPTVKRPRLWLKRKHRACRSARPRSLGLMLILEPLILLRFVNSIQRRVPAPTYIAAFTSVGRCLLFARSKYENKIHTTRLASQNNFHLKHAHSTDNYPILRAKTCRLEKKKVSGFNSTFSPRARLDSPALFARIKVASLPASCWFGCWQILDSSIGAANYPWLD